MDYFDNVYEALKTPTHFTIMQLLPHTERVDPPSLGEPLHIFSELNSGPKR